MVFYAFGSNGNHQLGLGEIDDDVSHPSAINADFLEHDPIEQVVSGGNHTMFLTSKGKMWVTGSNECNELGLVHSEGMKGNVLTEFINIPGDWKLASGGWQFSVVVNKQNRIFSAGNGPKGELGLGPNVTHSEEFKLVQKDPGFPGSGDGAVVDIKAGLAHTLVLLADGSVWGFGVSRKGQLGPANIEQKSCHKLVCVYGDKTAPITDICCGREFSVLGNRHTGFIKVLGPDKFGLVSGIPRNLLGYKKLCCGWSSIHVLNDAGEIISWGNDSHSQLAVNSPDNFFTEIVIGSEHGLAIDAKTKVLYAWGWGEHGNCGPEGMSSERGMHKVFDLKGVSNVKIWAGHATSWVRLDKEI